MLKLWAYILSLFVLTQALGFNANTFLSLDEVLTHYQVHQEEYGDDLFTFLNLHYGSLKTEHQNEHDEHKDLPSADFSHTQTQIVFLSVSDFNLQPVEIDNDKSLNVVYTDNYFSSIITEVFQPPKHFDWS